MTPELQGLVAEYGLPCPKMVALLISGTTENDPRFTHLAKTGIVDQGLVHGFARVIVTTTLHYTPPEGIRAYPTFLSLWLQPVSGRWRVAKPDALLSLIDGGYQDVSAQGFPAEDAQLQTPVSLPRPDFACPGHLSRDATTDVAGPTGHISAPWLDIQQVDIGHVAKTTCVSIPLAQRPRADTEITLSDDHETMHFSIDATGAIASDDPTTTLHRPGDGFGEIGRTVYLRLTNIWPHRNFWFTPTNTAICVQSTQPGEPYVTHPVAGGDAWHFHKQYANC
jgi:hypothetical protein